MEEEMNIDKPPIVIEDNYTGRKNGLHICFYCAKWHHKNPCRESVRCTCLPLHHIIKTDAHRSKKYRKRNKNKRAYK